VENDQFREQQQQPRSWLMTPFSPTPQFAKALTVFRATLYRHIDITAA
jgi:hypothetical protein